VPFFVIAWHLPLETAGALLDFPCEGETEGRALLEAGIEPIQTKQGV